MVSEDDNSTMVYTAGNQSVTVSSALKVMTTDGFHITPLRLDQHGQVSLIGAQYFGTDADNIATALDRLRTLGQDTGLATLKQFTSPEISVIVGTQGSHVSVDQAMFTALYTSSNKYFKQTFCVVFEFIFVLD